MSNTVNTPERARRIAEAWGRAPSADLDTIVAQVDEELELEAAEDADRRERATELVESATAFWSCRACGASTGPGVRDGYCGPCRNAAYVLAGLDRLEDDIGGYSRRELIQRDLDRRAGRR
jgi:hypothetical protein